MTRHPLDGNALAADAHYDRQDKSDLFFCAYCHRPFRDGPDDEPENGGLSDQSGTRWNLCADCEDE